MPQFTDEEVAALIIPVGWKLVPIEPTDDMIRAAKGALYRYIAGLPQEERDKAKGLPRPGLRVGWRKKYTIRYQAMLEVAPCP